MPRLQLTIVLSFLILIAACGDGGDHNPSAPDGVENIQQPLSAYVQEQRDFIDAAIAEGRSGTYGGLLHIVNGVVPPLGSFDEDLDLLNNRADTADFALPGLLTILAHHADSEALDNDQRQLIENAVINFKFWPDELEHVPGTTDRQTMVTWTENHFILFASGAYLAGQLYPDRVFPASGRTGREQMATFRPRLLRWLELRFRSGFSEWLSNVYYPADISALMALIDLAQDEELRKKSRIVLDLMLADMAINSFGGNFGATHGRSYTHKMNGSKDSTRGIAHLAFGLNRRHTTSKAASMMVVSKNYRVPEVLRLIASDVTTSHAENRQRMGIRLEEAASWGLGLDRIEDGMLLMTMEPYAHPLFIELFYNLLNEYQWWDHRDFKPFKDYRAVLDDPASRAAVAQLYEWDITRNMRPEVNIYTYRTPRYMLGTAQDWRKGFGGDQASIWQATLGMEAVAFTTHPANEEDSGSSTPNSWVGDGTLPRAAQVKNVVISLYDVETREGLYYSRQPRYTHAYLPRAKFDDTVKDGNWFFARKDDAFLALWSSDPAADWVPAAETSLGGGGDYEIVATGEKTIWLCELGDAEEYGDFESFKAAIKSASLAADPQTLAISYDSPSQGTIEMSWTGAVLNNGVEVKLSNYDRYENPWSQSAFPAGEISFTHGDSYLHLDFDSNTRDASAYFE